jgi:hypothetical protein
MSDDTERAGLGKVIYSVEDQPGAEDDEEAQTSNAEVDEGSKESFPASDAPSYMGGASTITE